MVAKLKAIKAELQRRKHHRTTEVGVWLRKVVLGYYQYHAVPGNSTQLRIFSRRVCRLWRSVLVRRSQRAQVRWDPPGTYMVTVKAAGFSELKREGLTIEVGHLPTLDLILAVGAAGTVVEVSGEAPVICLLGGKVIRANAYLSPKGTCHSPADLPTPSSSAAHVTSSFDLLKRGALS